jgi:hypothetical protein
MWSIEDRLVLTLILGILNSIIIIIIIIIIITFQQRDPMLLACLLFPYLLTVESPPILGSCLLRAARSAPLGEGGGTDRGMKARAAERRPTKLRILNEKKIGRKRRTHQIWPISGRECICDILDYDNGGRGDQHSDPLHNLASIKHLHGLLAQISDLGEVTHQACP